MSLSIYDDPTSGGINIFGYGDTNELILKRQDIDVLGVNEGIDGFIDVSLSSNPGIVVNDYVYVYSSVYDDSGQVIDVSGNIITVNVLFKQVTAGGYCNYKKDYFIEYKFTDVDNEKDNLLGYTIKNDGTNSGFINIDLTLANDLNDFQRLVSSGELTDQRIKYTLYYRESWRDNTNETFIAFPTEIIIVMTYLNVVQNDFAYKSEEVNFWLGYPIGINFIRSDITDSDKRISTKYNALDNNKATVLTNIQVQNFNQSDVGQLYSDMKLVSVPDEVLYLEMLFELIDIADYKAVDYADGDYQTN